MTEQNARLGILLMIATTFVFAVQDGISRHLSEGYNVFMVVMLRYWFLAAFVCLWALRRAGGIREVARTTRPWLQIGRGLLLAAEICVAVYGFVLLGLVESHAIFACYPLLIAALAGPILGEVAGWRRWLAIAVGFVGVLIILRPGAAMFSPLAIIPFISALMFALYGLLTRLAGRTDSTETSFFWTGVAGAALMTVVGLPNWEWMTPVDALWMATLCLTGAGGHWLLIRAYEVTEASTIQPFAYFQLVFATMIGITVFGETLRANVALGAVIVVSAGLFALWREQVRRRRARYSTTAGLGSGTGSDSIPMTGASVTAPTGSSGEQRS